MDIQTTYLKAVHLLLSWQLIWTRMVQSHPLQGEEAYFDGCHSQCVGYKILALFVYHPARWHVLRLAIMKVKCKSTHEITVFL